jgi:hypothetical protein
MAIRFLCPFGHRLMVPDAREGKRGRCPICGQMVIVPVCIPDPSQREKRSWDAGNSQGPAVDPGVLATLGFSDDEGAASASPGLVTQFTVEEAAASPASAAPTAKTPLPAAAPAATPAGSTIPPPPPVSTRVFAEGPAPEPVYARPGAKPGVSAAEPGKVFEGLDELLGSVAATQSAPARATPQARAPVSVVVSPPPRASSLPSAGSSSIVVSSSPAGQVPGAVATSVSAGTAVAVSAPRPRRVDPHWIHTAYWLAFALAAVTLFSAAPAMQHLNLFAAPGWARAMLLVATLQFAYIIWMVLVPDWSTVWVGMIVFVVVATMYGMMLLLAVAASAPLPLGLSNSRGAITGWAAAAMLMNGLMVYVCARIGTAWRNRAESVQNR